MRRTNAILLLAALLLLGGCANDENVTPTALPAQAATATMPVGAVVTVEIAPDGLTEDGYWNGGKWSDLPVYSLQLGISQKAHEHFQACGANDSSIEELVRVHMRRASERITLSSRIIVSAYGDPDATPTFSRVMNIERLEPSVYVVTCEVQ